MLIILVLIYCGFIFYKALSVVQVSDGELSVMAYCDQPEVTLREFICFVLLTDMTTINEWTWSHWC